MTDPRMAGKVPFVKPLVAVLVRWPGSGRLFFGSARSLPAYWLWIA